MSSPKPKLMTKAEHRKRHQELHKALDELVADFIRHECKFTDAAPKMPGNTTVMELMKWSHQQTLDPAGEHAPAQLN